MADWLRPSPRIRELVTEARRALALRSRLVAGGSAPDAVDDALDTVYRDLGAELVSAVIAAEAMIPDAPSAPGEHFTDELPDYEAEEPGGWYSDEVERTGQPSLPMFEERDLDEHTDVPESEAGPPAHDPDDTDPGGADAFPIASPASMGGAMADASRAGAPSAALDQLLDLLALPAGFDDPDELAVEASRVQWATTDLGAHLSGLPDDVVVCIVGLLAARAQHLRDRLDIDVGPRLSLDRLQRYRLDRGLATVAALLPSPKPDHGAWAEDAAAWWRLLRPSA